MKMRLSVKILSAIIAAVMIASLLTACKEPDPPQNATPSQAAPLPATPGAATPDAPPTPPVPPSPPTVSEDNDEELDFFETFGDFPAHFVTHGGRPGDEAPTEFYLHATIDISGDGTMKGELFSNLESTDSETIEQTSSWTGRIAGNKVYRTEEGSYYFYVEDVVYKNEPNTEAQSDGKTLKYVYGFGLDPELDNRLELFVPGTPIESLYVEGSQQDIGQFLTMMRKEGDGESLECYLLRGRIDNNYISLTEEEYSMGPPQEPQPPQQP